MKNISLYFLLLISLPALSQDKKSTPTKPKLVIGIVVDQMRTDYITRYWDKFGKGGFKRLVDEGYNCRNARYNYTHTFTGPGHASIYTGTTPCTHGIIANDWFDRKTNDTVYCVEDNSVRSVGGDSLAGEMSPHRLLTTTITDELQLATLGKAKVIGISLKDRGAILPAGRMADAAYWFDAKTGNWITSTWYMKELPEWMNDFNKRKLPAEYLSEPWNTLLPIENYTESNADDNIYEAPFKGEDKPVFPHNFPKIKDKGFELVRKSPFGNTLTKEVAVAAIEGEHLGQNSTTDFLCVSFSSTDYVGHQFGPMSVEAEDTYLRLDRDLSEFINYLDKKIGKENYLLFLTADHAAANNPQESEDEKLAAGFNNDKSVTDSIKSFLKNNYGKPDYFSSYINNEIYFDETKIANDKIDLCDIQLKTANYILQNVPGVADAMTACNLQHIDYSQLFKINMQHGFMMQRSGDVWILFEPARTDKLFGSNGKQGTTHGTPYAYDTHVPLIWYGWNIPHGNTTREILIPDIATTLSFMLNTELPNGCTGKTIPELMH